MSQSPAQLILASGSPRRRQLLQQLGISFEVFASDVDESKMSGETAQQYVLRLAGDKAMAARNAWPGPVLPVLGADTTVVLDNSVLGKPGSGQQAAEMLRSLSGRDHQVMSAMAVISADGNLATALNITTVSFRQLSNSEILNYCATGEPMDKAGAYAIQGLAAGFIRHIEGSYSGVMGLPLYETAELLAKAGVSTALGAQRKA